MYTISTRFGPASLTARPRSAGGAVPAFFFRPFVFAVSVVPFTRISHVGGNSIGACSAVARYVLGVWYVDDVQYSRSWYFGLPARREYSECSGCGAEAGHLGHLSFACWSSVSEKVRIACRRSLLLFDSGERQPSARVCGARRSAGEPYPGLRRRGTPSDRPAERATA
jgi:hypothetical protein